jgi:hypothetical protein
MGGPGLEFPLRIIDNERVCVGTADRTASAVIDRQGQVEVKFAAPIEASVLDRGALVLVDEQGGSLPHQLFLDHAGCRLRAFVLSERHVRRVLWQGREMAER